MVMACHVPLAHWMNYGGYGLSLFFVLSGYLISGLLFAELESGSINVGRFLIRRGFKIYPAFYVFIALTCGLSTTRPWLPVEVFWLQSYWVPTKTIWGHTWSLAVEEHFYLLLPLLILALHRTRCMRLIPWISGVALIVGSVMRWYSTNRYSTHLNIHELFLGVAIRYVCDLRGWELPDSQVRWLKPLSYIGFYSYSIYLWHYPVARLFWNGAPHTVPMFAAYVAISLVLGIGMATAIEMPMLRVRERVMPKRKAPLVKSEAPALVSPVSFSALLLESDQQARG